MNDANTLHTLTVAVDSSAMDDVLFSHNDANGTESDTSLQVCQVAAPGATLLATVTYVLLYLVLLQNAKNIPVCCSILPSTKPLLAQTGD